MAAAADGMRRVFGLPAGRYDITVAYNPFSGVSQITGHPIWVPEDGVVPLLPAWVEFFY